MELNKIYLGDAYELIKQVPKGFVVHHINKISNDDRIENLVCVSRKEHINIHREDLK